MVCEVFPIRKNPIRNIVTDPSALVCLGLPWMGWKSLNASLPRASLCGAKNAIYLNKLFWKVNAIWKVFFDKMLEGEFHQETKFPIAGNAFEFPCRLNLFTLKSGIPKSNENPTEIQRQKNAFQFSISHPLISIRKMLKRGGNQFEKIVPGLFPWYFRIIFVFPYRLAYVAKK